MDGEPAGSTACQDRHFPDDARCDMAMASACAGKADPGPQPTSSGQPTVSFVASTPSRPDHVVVVILENKDAQTSSLPAPISGRSPRRGCR